MRWQTGLRKRKPRIQGEEECGLLCGQRYLLVLPVKKSRGTDVSAASQFLMVNEKKLQV